MNVNNELVIKIQMVRFLMQMFERSISMDTSSGVKVFKARVEDLVCRNQIPVDVKLLVYKIYGIQNTDVFVFQKVQNKLMQLNWLMMDADSCNLVYMSSDKKKAYLENLNKQVKGNVVLKSVRDIMVEMYNLGGTSVVEEPIFERPIQNKSNSKVENDKEGYIYKTESGIQRENSVIKDIMKIKEEYLKNMYYVYPNPSYDGCSGSSSGLVQNLLKSISKPVGAKLLYREESSDGCHTSYSYQEITNEMLKRPKIEKPIIKNKPSVPKSSPMVKTPKPTLDYCSGGMSSSRFC